MVCSQRKTGNSQSIKLDQTHHLITITCRNTCSIFPKFGGVMNDKLIVILIVGLPSIIGMSCILYSIFYEKDTVEDSIIQYKPKQPILISTYDDELDTDTEYYVDKESEDSGIDYINQDSIYSFVDES